MLSTNHFSLKEPQPMVRHASTVDNMLDNCSMDRPANNLSEESWMASFFKKIVVATLKPWGYTSTEFLNVALPDRWIRPFREDDYAFRWLRFHALAFQILHTVISFCWDLWKDWHVPPLPSDKMGWLKGWIMEAVATIDNVMLELVWQKTLLATWFCLCYQWCSCWICFNL